jgi:two-component system C4-dicarboxylate transport response regulator DctD
VGVKPLQILVVDDEAALSALLKKYLERLGYLVDTCSEAAQALALLKSQPERYAAVVTDLALPAISGEELLQQARALNPGLRGVITSGYAYKPRQAGVEFLQKPFMAKTLADLLERMLKTDGTPS